ncbi:MAG: hypothetical protein GY937_01395 [bacterium]|nr:hypothetical protein [bacterium]
MDIESGKPDVYSNFFDDGILPDVLNHNPRYVVEIGAVKAGALALTAVVMDYLSFPVDPR